MKKLLFVTFLLGGTLLTTGCSGDETAETPPAETPAAPAAAPAAPPAPEVVTPPDFTNPLVEESRPAAIGSLKKATDPAARLKQVQAGRPDPFAPNPVSVTVSLPKVISSSQLSSPTILPVLPVLPSLPPGNLITPDPDLVLVPTVILPNPALAKAVVVTGVVQVGSSPQAIVKAPLEPSSRYVSPGQRISNGQVLVKRIEVRGSEPVVILEELGIEVVKFIGSPAENLPEEPGATEEQIGTVPGIKLVKAG